MASTLYISLPSRVAAQHLTDWASQALAFALISAEGRLQQQGQSTLAELKPLAAGARQVAFILAASDTSLLNVKVPPMSAAKLKQALPNLLEDQLISDPADLVLVSGDVVNGEITVAVTDKHWLEGLAKRVKDWPLKKFSAYPAQLALAFDVASQTASAVIDEKEEGLELGLRDGTEHGLGLSLENTGVAQALTMLAQLSASPKVTAYVPGATVEACQLAIKAEGLDEKLTVMPVSWVNRVAGINSSTPDLMTGVAAEHMASFDWNKWRWPLRLVIALAIINLLALNLEWFNMKREEKDQKNALLQIFRNAYPKETVISDSPLKQMQQKINIAKRAAGQFAANDFAVMAAQFSLVWDRVGVPGGVASIEYKDRSLFVRVKPNVQLPMDALRSALAEQSMTITTSTDGALRITTGGKS
ncbi:type II secretion system protein GspL [Undibacterium sp. Di27W]|uniref:type II secretion system protein GspL n=1 Tax=Undibacterium sp. Di27W TaxID=3413036 RepID=UPI003BF27745